MQAAERRYSIRQSDNGRWWGVYLSGALVATFDTRDEAADYVASKEAAFEEMPCDACGVLTLPSLLGFAPQFCGLDRRICESCFDRACGEQEEEDARINFEAQQVRYD